MAGVRWQSDSEASGEVADRRSDDGNPDPGLPLSGWSSRQFGLGLLAIVAIGVLARLFFVFVWTWGVPLHGDPAFYQQTAAHLAHGDGYVSQFLGKGPLVPTAVHPPVFALALAALDLIGIRSVDAHRVALAFLSAGGVLAVGLLGRRLAGPGVGLLVAGIAACDPLWVQQSGFLMSESVYLIIIPTMLLFALAVWTRPTD